MLMLVQQTWLDDLAQKPNVLVTTGASERFKLSLVGLRAPVIWAWPIFCNRLWALLKDRCAGCRLHRGIDSEFVSLSVLRSLGSALSSSS